MQNSAINNRKMNDTMKQTQMCQSMITQTQKFLRNVSDYKKRHQPIELQIQLGGGLKKVTKGEKLVEIDLPDIKLENNHDLIINNLQKHDGLISEQLYVSRKLQAQELEKSLRDQIIDLQTKVMICITMYSEPLNELQKTIHAIEDSLQEFYDNGITSNQITIVVLFDGIEHIRNQNDENGKNIEQDIIPFFCQTYDKPYQIQEDQTLEQMYKKYKLYKENLKKYSKEQREKFKKLTLDQQKNFLRNDKYLRPKIYSTDKFSLTQQEVQKVVEKMEELYQKSQTWIQSKQNNAHVYQTSYKVKTIDKGIINEMNIYYVFKYANGTKLSSHLWFFKGFCKELNPEYCVLMDCGAIPQKGSIFKLINEMIHNPKVGGVCGTMTIQFQDDQQKNDNMDFITKILNSIFSIQRCQKCEYDIGNIIDKQFESSLNFIQVLPGAYSAYRYKAFEQKYNQNDNQNNKESILNYYLKSKLDPNYEHQSIDEANMFLAEDRVLCLSLFCNSYYLKYVRDAYVEVDPCLTLIMLLFQRRRWINGSWFALNYVINTFYQKLKNSGHTNYDKFKFYLCLVFARLSQGQQYFTVSFQVIWLYMILNTILSDSDPIINSAVKQFIIGLYIFFVFNLIMLSIFFNPSIIQQIQNSADREKERNKLNSYFYSKFYGISTILGLLSLINAGYTIYLFISEIMVKQYFLLFMEQPHVLSAYIYLFVAVSLFLTIFPFILQFFIDPQTVLSIAINSIHYIYFQPTYTHLFLIYSFCRIDDLSWGTKGLVVDEQNAQSSSKYEKYIFVLKWVVSNVIFSTSIYLLFYLNIEFIYVGIILIFSVGFTIIQLCKLIGFFSFWIHQIQCKFQSRTTSNEPHGRKNSRKSSINQQNIKKKMYKLSEEPINLTQMAN